MTQGKIQRGEIPQHPPLIVQAVDLGLICAWICTKLTNIFGFGNKYINFSSRKFLTSILPNPNPNPNPYTLKSKPESTFFITNPNQHLTNPKALDLLHPYPEMLILIIFLLRYTLSIRQAEITRKLYALFDYAIFLKLF